MRSKLLLPALLLLAGCAAMQQMQQQTIAQNTAISPNFDQNRIYSLAILPPTSNGAIDEAGNIEGLREFAGMTMIKTGRFTEVERSRIDVALKEQEFGTSGIVDPGTAARLGKVLGADAVLLTTIVSTKNDPFFNDPKQRETELNVRIVSSSTAEVLFRGRGQGSSFNGELEAWQSAFAMSVAGIPRKGGN
jgi:curli biogenesis system outer membrane secretion channel CsgG